MDAKCLQVFGRRLKGLREGNGISQRELADIIGISKGAVYYYESDGRAPDIVTLEKIADYFDVSTDYLLGRTNSRSKKPLLKAICDKTGLSNKSVLMLARLKKEKCSNLRIINLLLEQADDDIEDNYELEGRYEGSVLNAVCRYLDRYQSIDQYIMTFSSDEEITSSIRSAMYQLILNQANDAIKDFANSGALENELWLEVLPEGSLIDEDGYII